MTEREEIGRNFLEIIFDKISRMEGLQGKLLLLKSWKNDRVIHLHSTHALTWNRSSVFYKVAFQKARFFKVSNQIEPSLFFFFFPPLNSLLLLEFRANYGL